MDFALEIFCQRRQQIISKNWSFLIQRRLQCPYINQSTIWHQQQQLLSKTMSLEQSLLPLDSGIQNNSETFEAENEEGSSNRQLHESQSEIEALTEKLSELEITFAKIQKQYREKIQSLRGELKAANQYQSKLNEEMLELSKEYEAHKSEIENISLEIQKSLENNNANISSVNSSRKSPKGTKSPVQKHLATKNSSPLRIIKKNLDNTKKQHQQHKRLNSDKFDQKSVEQSHSETIDSKSIQSSQTGIVSRQSGGKKIYSPNQSSNNGPSPKKNMLFNSSKELNIFGKPKNRLHQGSGQKNQTLEPVSPRKVKTKLLNSTDRHSFQETVLNDLTSKSLEVEQQEQHNLQQNFSHTSQKNRQKTNIGLEVIEEKETPLRNHKNGSPFSIKNLPQKSAEYSNKVQLKESYEGTVAQDFGSQKKSPKPTKEKINFIKKNRSQQQIKINSAGKLQKQSPSHNASNSTNDGPALGKTILMKKKLSPTAKQSNLNKQMSPNNKQGQQKNNSPTAKLSNNSPSRKKIKSTFEQNSFQQTGFNGKLKGRKQALNSHGGIGKNTEKPGNLLGSLRQQLQHEIFQ